MLHRFLAGVVSLLLLAACATPQATAPAPSAAGMVSAADPRAAEAGAEMLRQGGSATDAAIATMLALTVVEPQSSGIGGGGFFVRGTRTGEVTTLDGRETAPSAATPDWFLEDGRPLAFKTAVLSGLSVGVPGNLRLAQEAHRQYGKLDWSTLFQPAIRLARDGFRISPRLHEFLTRFPDRAGRNAEGRALFYDASGDPLPTGTLVTNPALAATFQAVAGHGADYFYQGAAASAFARRVKEQTPRGGGMEAADLAAYRVKERAPVCGAYRTYRICGMGPPSSGATTVFAILKQLERFDLATLGSTSPVAWHLIAESTRLAYADRDLYLADSDFVPVPVAGLSAPDYLAARGKAISPIDTMASVAAGQPDGAAARPGTGESPPEGGTSHFVAVDKAGNAVSYTSTIEGPFGSGIIIGGYYLNNELTDFSFMPERDGKMVANRVEGRKRPRSSMAPTLVYTPDGHLLLAVGAAGGATIPVQVARAIIGVIDWRLNPEQALALPVIYTPEGTIYVEKGSALEEMIPSLHALGHEAVVARELPLKTNAVLWTGRDWHGVADPRSEGAAISE